jgi:hypothetical protein
MTADPFDLVAPQVARFNAALQQFFSSARCVSTLQLLAQPQP